MSITTAPTTPTLSASTTSARNHRTSPVVGRRASRDQVLDSSADVFGSSSSPARQGVPSTVVHSPESHPSSFRSTASQAEPSKSLNKQSLRPPPIMLRRPTVSRPAEEDDGFGEGLEGLGELPASPARNEFQRSMQPSPRTNGFLASPRFQPPPSPADQGRRIHARNLSLYFPQPGQPSTSEASGTEPEAPVVDITNDSGRGAMNGFKFGRKPPPESLPVDDEAPATTKPSRRGHHHKHSLSHNFFSFLDPTATNPGLAGPAPLSPTPWPPLLPSPTSDVPTPVPIPQLSSPTPTTLPSPYDATKPSLQAMSPGDQLALGFAIAQFFLGASLWVDGQAGGSVSVAGMGYLVVFDALGVAVSVFGRKSQRQGGAHSSTVRRPYGSLRFDTLMYFVQCLFLVFAAVYIAKESVEHVLLEGHSHSHHHASHDTDVDEPDELSYPLMLLLYSTISAAFSGIFLSNHSRLVEAVGPILIPSFLAHASPPYRERSTFSLSDRVVAFFGNPFSLTVSVLSAGMLIGGLVVSPFHMGTLDTSLSLILAITTLLLSYPPTVAFGHVLLQTAPSPSSDQMRATRTALEQIEADERVRGIANVRCWRVGAGSGARFSGALRRRPPGSPTSPYTSFVPVDPAAGPAQLVVTIIISLADSASDVDVLAVTKMAWGRLSKAVNDGEGTGEVCVMVRKGDGLVERTHVHHHVHDHGSHEHSASGGPHAHDHDHGHSHGHGAPEHGCDHDAQSHAAHDKHVD